MTTEYLEQHIWEALKKVMDPELHIDIVSLGLIYEVTAAMIQTPSGESPFAHILLTLTTPGCPLAGMFDTLIKDALTSIPEFNPHQQLEIEITFDPPWVPDMMNEEARAELGFD